MNRVVITGIGIKSPLGSAPEVIFSTLQAQKNKVSKIDALDDFNNLNCRLACPVSEQLPDYPRKKTRSMGRVGILATAATELALQNANLSCSEELSNGNTGVAYGSSAGTISGINDVAKFINQKDVRFLNALSYVQIMPHSVAVNLAIFFGIHGRIIPTSSACTSASQAIGYAYESIKYGQQKLMIAGGAEELSPLHIGVFDALFATTQTTEPLLTPRPFDQKRDGIVIGEGAGTLILEELEHAKARNARIYGEIIGFATNCDATHVTNPSSVHMEECMRQALKNAYLSPYDIDYINARGTGTFSGDAAEGCATYRIFGNRTPVSSLKSYMGHTLGACGAMEIGISLLMQEHEWFAPNLNFSTPDKEFADLNLINGNGLSLKTTTIMSNNFAFGGVNTSLIIRRI
ncbi:MAG: beta-ketoacyl-ACP synthase [Succinivibrionaceae bacterium]|nr:beta-ketoacyl-ACP synthase [Succinivibrionaceae bacterium]